MEISPVSRVIPVASVDPGAHLEPPALTHQLVTAVRALNKAELFGKDRELEFTRDADTHHPIIRISDRVTGEIVEQIPPETVLRMFAAMKQQQEEQR